MHATESKSGNKQSSSRTERSLNSRIQQKVNHRFKYSIQGCVTFEFVRKMRSFFLIIIVTSLSVMRQSVENDRMAPNF